MKSTYTKDPATAMFEASPWSPADRGMYFIWDFTQLNVRPHSRVGLLKYKTAPKCSLSGPFRHSGVGRNPGAVGPVRSYNLNFTYPCQLEPRGENRSTRKDNQSPNYPGTCGRSPLETIPGPRIHRTERPPQRERLRPGLLEQRLLRPPRLRRRRPDRHLH